jgi:hypothetical protein
MSYIVILISFQTIYSINYGLTKPQNIVFRDMVWKLSKLQSGYNELGFYVEPYIICFRFINIEIAWLNDWTETLLLDDLFIILNYNVFIDRALCTKLHIKREQKDRTKTLAEFPNHVLKDNGCVYFRNSPYCYNLNAYISAKLNPKVH